MSYTHIYKMEKIPQQIRLTIILEGGAQQVLSFNKSQLSDFTDNKTGWQGTDFSKSKDLKKKWTKLSINEKLTQHYNAFTHDIGGKLYIAREINI